MALFLLCPRVRAALELGKQTPAEKVFDQSRQKAEVDDFTAFQNFKILAKKGDPAAQDSLGVMYRDGRGTEQSFEEAMKWFGQAADQKYAKAVLHLGLMQSSGQGVPPDYEEGMRWIRQAADLGDPEAQYDFGVMTLEGRRFTGYEEEAVKWIQKSAEKGFPPALREMGQRYAGDHGISRDDHAAYYCLYLSFLLGERPGFVLWSVERRLTEEQIFKIQQEARDWLRKNKPQESANEVQSSTATLSVPPVPAPVSPGGY